MQEKENSDNNVLKIQKMLLYYHFLQLGEQYKYVMDKRGKEIKTESYYYHDNWKGN